MSGSSGGQSDHNEASEQQAAIARLRESLRDVVPQVQAQTHANGRHRRERTVTPVVVSLLEVEQTTVQWLWRHRLARGKLHLVAGDPGVGKSTITTDMAARLSAGRGWPDGEPNPFGGEPANVVILSAEDAADDTLKPRVMAAGGDCAFVHLIPAVRQSRLDPETGDWSDEEEEVPLSLPAHVEQLEQVVRDKAAALVVIDPINAFLDDRVESKDDHRVRRALRPLVQMAERTGCCVLMVAHLNKAQTMSALYRISGTIAYVAYARIAHVVTYDPDDEESEHPSQRRRVFACLKTNFASPPSLTFELRETSDEVARVCYLGTSQHTAQSALEGASEKPEEKTAQTEAVEFLRARLADGPLPAAKLLMEGRDIGLSERTLRRACKQLGIVAEPEHQTEPKGARFAGWRWRLPARKGAHDGHAS